MEAEKIMLEMRVINRFAKFSNVFKNFPIYMGLTFGDTKKRLNILPTYLCKNKYPVAKIPMTDNMLANLSTMPGSNLITTSLCCG